MKCVYFYSSFVIGIKVYACILRNVFRKPFYPFFLEFLLSASHFISLNSLRKGLIRQKKKKWNQSSECLEDIIDILNRWKYSEQRKLSKSVNQSAGITWFVKTRKKRKYWTRAWQGSWCLLPFFYFEDHETSPSVSGDGERISSKNWQCEYYFTCSFYPPWLSFLFCLSGWGVFLLFKRHLILKSWRGQGEVAGP